MKAASNHIILFSDHDLLHCFVKEEFPWLNIISRPNSSYHEDSKNIKNAIILLDSDSQIKVNDQFINKPFPAEVLTKVITNQLTLSQENCIKIGAFDFFPGRKTAIGEGQTILFTDKEAELLAYLFKSGETVNKDELLMQIWGYKNEIETKTLETHIYKLKQKMPILKKVICRHNLGYSIDKQCLIEGQ